MTVIVRKSDVIAAGFCGAGMREWCRLNGITAAQVRDGIPAEQLLATGCELASQVVEAATIRHNDEGDR